MYGKWLYVAIATIFGCVFVLQSPLVASFLFICVLIKLYADQANKQLMISSCFFLLSLIISLVHEHNNFTDVFAGPIEMHIQFLEKINMDGNRLSVHVRGINNEKFVFVYYIRTLAEKEKLSEFVQPGYVCHTKGTLTNPKEPRNEHAFNYGQYLYYSNIHWVYEVDILEACVKTSPTFIQAINQLRSKFIRKVADIYPHTLIPYAQALLFGDRTQFEDDLYRSYQKLGIVHLLAISGLHIGLFVSMIYYLLLRIGLTKEQIYYLFIFILPIYALLSGANPPVVRAVMMTLLILSSLHFKLPVTSLDTLAISCILFLLLNPYALFQVGFQLSYVISFTIIVSIDLLSKFHSYLYTSFSISIISTIGSIPIMAYHFYEISFISLFANIIFVPLYSFILVPFFLFTFFVSHISDQVFTLTTTILEPIILYSEKFVLLTSNIPFATITLGKPNVIWIAIFCLVIIVFFVLWEKQQTVKVAAVPVIFMIFLQMTLTTFNVKGEVIFIDVGQGDSILIRLPFNRGTYLIDTGGVISFADEEWKKRSAPYEVGKQVITPLLKSKGITRIDKLIITHGHFDHAGGATALFSEFKIKEMYLPPNSWGKPFMKDIIQEAAGNHTEVYSTMAGEAFHNQSGNFVFLSPMTKMEDGNNNSLVLYAQFGGYDWLFTGDLEEEGELNLLSTGKSIKADILKIGHHGSHTSTTSHFLEAVDPIIAIISVGENNRYHHPNEEVINRLKEENIVLFRTDMDGAVHYEFIEFRGTVQGNWRKILKE